MIYLASPYSHPDPVVRQERFYAAVREAAYWWRRGHVVFSPIAHSHPIALHGLSGDWAQWAEFDRTIIATCSALWILELPGWRESKGIEAERRYAEELGIPVVQVQPEAVS